METNTISIRDLRTTVKSKLDREPDGFDFGMSFERALFQELMSLGRQVLERELSSLEPNDNEVFADGEVWRRAVVGRGHYTSCFGEITVERGLYRAHRNGPTRCFVNERYGMLDGRWTPEAARLAALLLTDQTTRSASTFFREQGGMTPSRTKLEHLPSRIGSTIEAHRERLERELRRSYSIPDKATSVSVSLDGVMVKLQKGNRKERVAAAKAEGRKVGGPIGSNEASVASLSFYDAQGERLLTRRFARMPEAQKTTLKATLRAELATVRAARPDLIVVAVSDGAPNNWSFLKALDPDHEVVDAYHTLENIKRRLDRTLGVGTHLNQAIFKAMKGTLLKKPGGHLRVFARLDKIEKAHNKYKERKRTGRGAQPTFYERHSDRMRYAELHAATLPIGSGVVEGTARYMVVDRLRRTGMRWKTNGGQAILNLRQYAANDQFNLAWETIMNLEAANEQANWKLAS